jgi:hypothetical protein
MTDILDPPNDLACSRAADPLPMPLRDADVWTDHAVAEAGFIIRDTPIATVGGGIGSFVTADYLRVAGGVLAADIRVLSNSCRPTQTYEHLTRVSQIPRTERIRSDAASRPDNIWGFPSYAVQEAFQSRTPAPLAQVLVEPVFADFYTPRLGAVLDGVEREAARIGYMDMLELGDVRTVRRRADSGYFAVLVPPAAGATPTAFRCRDVHVAVGYSGLGFLPELRRFRTTHDDYHRWVHAYEDHEHVYQTLRARPCTVLVRGGGIVASRILERLLTDRARLGLQTQVVHLLRTYVDGTHGPHPWSRRRGADGFAYQGFNYPKSVWGGQLKASMRRLEGAERADAYAGIAGTTTAWRRSWQRQLREGRAGGWYRTIAGVLDEVVPDSGGVTARVRVADGTLLASADFIIDCTGLNADVSEHMVLRDLLCHGGAGRNPLGRMNVERTFELRGTASGDGRIYLTGAAALGGYFPGVDTFLGLQIAAQEVVDDMARRGHCLRMGSIRSIREWMRWARRLPPLAS